MTNTTMPSVKIDNNMSRSNDKRSELGNNMIHVMMDDYGCSVEARHLF